MIDRFLQSTIFYALRDLVSFVQFKNVKNTHGGVLLLVELPAKSLITYMNPSTLIVDEKFLPYRLFRNVLYNNCKKKFNYILQVSSSDVCVSGGKNVRFSENLACFAFLLPPF